MALQIASDGECAHSRYIATKMTGCNASDEMEAKSEVATIDKFGQSQKEKFIDCQGNDVISYRKTPMDYYQEVLYTDANALDSHHDYPCRLQTP